MNVTLFPIRLRWNHKNRNCGIFNSSVLFELKHQGPIWDDDLHESNVYYDDHRLLIPPEHRPHQNIGKWRERGENRKDTWNCVWLLSLLTGTDIAWLVWFAWLIQCVYNRLQIIKRKKKLQWMMMRGFTSSMILRVEFSRRKKNFEIESIHSATQHIEYACVY